MINIDWKLSEVYLLIEMLSLVFGTIIGVSIPKIIKRKKEATTTVTK
jgi:hypothetical protein